MLEILKHGKIWGTVCTSVVPLQILGRQVPLSHLIYSHVASAPLASCFTLIWHRRLLMLSRTRDEIGLLREAGR